MRIVLTGTGTAVGKTHVGCALLHALRQRGEQAIGLKPVETGGGDDAARLGGTAPRYAFAPPISPHLAARLAGSAIDLDAIVRWVGAHPSRWQIVETAGGLLTPLARRVTNLDLYLALAPAALVLVGSDRLGALHDISAALRALDGQRAIVCLSAPAQPDASTATNAEELSALGIADAIVFPRATHDDARTLAAASAVLERCETS